ncbi:MAG: sialidase family protein [Candidatus Eisenbacteria bacterium]
MRPTLVVLSFSLLLASCAQEHRAPSAWKVVQDVTPAALAAVNAADASVSSDGHGHAAATWVTRDSLGADAWVAVSSDSGHTWGEPFQLNEKPHAVSSYNESRPLSAWGPNGVLAVTFMNEVGVAMRVSTDAGRTWGPLGVANDDNANPLIYHGFTALDVLPDGRPILAWLDGRAFVTPDGGEPARVDIYMTTSNDGGRTWQPNTRVARDVCGCCRLGMTTAKRADGSADVAVVYRTASNEIRNARIALSHDNGTTFATDTLVANDQWHIEGCPMVGPQIVHGAKSGFVAWYRGESPDDSTAHGRPKPGVYLTTWDAKDGGSGGRISPADSLNEAAYPMLAATAEGALLGAVGSAVGGGEGAPKRMVMAVRHAGADHMLSPWLYLGERVQSGALASVGPRLALAAYTQGVEGSDSESRVRFVRISDR